MKKFLLLGFMLMLTFAFSESWAQERTVSGKVTSIDDGTALPGVNVVLKGTTTGTVTDIDGNYKLSVPSGEGTLVFSFIGLATEEIAIGTRSIIDVQMSQDVTQLSEVVVTAVGIERQAKALGYGVENVKGESVQQVSEPDPLRALQGKVAGVNISGSSGAPGSATRITIRGNSSLLGNNQPLFVVDGIPMNNNTNASSNQLTGGGAYGSRIQDLDPNNIESMNVLKGAAAAALYGTRAANGVVVITTKSGSAKASKKGLEISYSTSYAIEKVANLPDYQNTYGTGTNFAYSQVNGSWGAPFIGAKSYATLDSISHWYNGVIGFEEFWGTNVPYRAYPDNVKDFFQTGSLFENSVSVSAGNEKAALTAVLSRTNHDGIVPEASFDRTSVSIGGQAQLDNGFNIGANLRYTNSVQHSFQGGANNAIGNGSAFARTLYLGRNWDLHGQPYQNPLNNSSQFFVATSQADNPLWSVKNAGIDSNTDNFGAAFNIGYDIKDWLNVSYKIGLNGYTQRQSEYFRAGSRGAGGSGQILDYDVRFQEVESNFIVSVTKDINEDISFRGLVGHNVNQRVTDAQAFTGTGYVAFDIDDIDNTNAVVPSGGDFEKRRLYGVFGDVTFGYKDYVFLNLTGRNDWSSTLPKDNRSFFYPAASLSFLITDALDINSNILSFAKIRASYAEVGSDTNPYQIVPVYLTNANGINATGATAMPFVGTAGATLSNIARDPGLKPENTQEVEVGLNTQLFKNKVGIDVSVYERNSVDQIVPLAIPSETGFTSFYTNIGKVSNRGIELGLDLTPVSLDNGFTWNLYGTFTHNRNVVEELTEGTDEVVLRNTFTGSIQAVHIVGQEYGLLRGSRAARDDEGNLLIDPTNGQLITDLTPGIIGNPNPDFIVGLTNTFRWKGITLSAVIDWRQGGDLYSVTNLSMLGRGVTADTEDREVNKIIPGVYGNPQTGEPLRDEGGNKIPNQTMIEVNSLYFGNTFAINGLEEFSVWDATVIRLREVTLSYQFPKALLNKTPFGSASIGFTGRNLWFNAPNFPEASNFDPEVSTFGASNAQGFEFTAQPSTRRYGVKLSVTF
ncbi:SusC/RagA family TonB-linked outer membrane protein [Fulvivirga sp. 29W222]|uniref:SusC/RagA family TonB-linked outer membrane protein n=1 Tax=Fulvivirga marina TaxID=2494733 RepID=A0A937KCX6_9BACT|nr:SusC/RagA family TonB-linked outer membrane protein [Fulvivirga marina]MBL6447874.1 SusC/RagA family TonB-linked outer membrane protein [Fulvivirga marina]